MTGPSNEEQMEDNSKALDAGPLDEEEMAGVRCIGTHICGEVPQGPRAQRIQA